MKTNKLFFMDCHLAGRKYHDADEVWDYLRVGTRVRLERDLENRFDPYAVAVMLDKDGEAYCLGYLPRGENKTVADLLEMGWNGIFECRISRLDPDAHPEHQVHLTLRIVRHPEA